MNVAMDAFLALSRANAEFERRLHLIGTDDWPRSTPCAEWDVRALVNHVVGGNRRYRMLLRGASVEEVSRTRTKDHLGDDHLDAFKTTADELVAVFREPGALTRTAHHPLGDRAGAELLAMRVIDVIVHAWDIGHALAVDDMLDADAVGYALAHAGLIESLRVRGVFAASTGVPPSDPSLQERLLYLTGRSIEGPQA